MRRYAPTAITIGLAGGLLGTALVARASPPLLEGESDSVEAVARVDAGGGSAVLSSCVGQTCQALAQSIGAQVGQLCQVTSAGCPGQNGATDTVSCLDGCGDCTQPPSGAIMQPPWWAAVTSQLPSGLNFNLPGGRALCSLLSRIPYVGPALFSIGEIGWRSNWSQTNSNSAFGECGLKKGQTLDRSQEFFFCGLGYSNATTDTSTETINGCSVCENPPGRSCAAPTQREDFRDYANLAQGFIEKSIPIGVGPFSVDAILRLGWGPEERNREYKSGSIDNNGNWVPAPAGGPPQPPPGGGMPPPGIPGEPPPPPMPPAQTCAHLRDCTIKDDYNGFTGTLTASLGNPNGAGVGLNLYVSGTGSISTGDVHTSSVGCGADATCDGTRKIFRWTLRAGANPRVGAFGFSVGVGRYSIAYGCSYTNTQLQGPAACTGQNGWQNQCGWQ